MTGRAGLAAAAIGGTLVFLGLAILGAGGFAAFFSRPPLAALTATTLALTVAGLLSEGNLSPGLREDRSNRWVFAAFGALGALSAYLPALMDRRDVWTFGGEGTRWLGVLLYAAGGVVRLAPVFALGRRFSGLVAIQPGHRLVTDGIYRHIRHPSYLGLIVMSFGWALAFRSVAGLILAALTLAPTDRPHPGRGAPARLGVRRRVRRLPGPHMAARSGPLLTAPVSGPRGRPSCAGGELREFDPFGGRRRPIPR